MRRSNKTSIVIDTTKLNFKEEEKRSEVNKNVKNNNSLIILNNNTILKSSKIEVSGRHKSKWTKARTQTS